MIIVVRYNRVFATFYITLFNENFEIIITIIITDGVNQNLPVILHFSYIILASESSSILCIEYDVPQFVFVYTWA